MQLTSPGPETTREFAAALASVVDDTRLVVALIGPLGAGKTVFAKGVAAGLGIDPDAVTSPTFAIASEYRSEGTRRLAHVDLYRVASIAELDAAGFLDLLDPGTLVLVEWGDRLPGALPADHLEVSITRPSPCGEPVARGARKSPESLQRVVNAVAFGAVSETALERWEAAISEGATGRD